MFTKTAINLHPSRGVDAQLNFDECAEYYILELITRGYSHKTIARYREILCRFKKYLNDKDFTALDKRDLKFFVSALYQRRNDPQTINKSARLIKNFYAFLIQEELISFNPFGEFKKIKEIKKIIEAFSYEQVKKMLSLCPKKSFKELKFYLVLQMFIDTGVRLSELLNIKLLDIQWEESKIKILGKGAKERFVYMGNELKKNLYRYLLLHNKENPYLFYNDFEKQLTGKSIDRFIKTIAKKAGAVGIRASAHTLRHTFAKLWILNGGDIFSLQKLLGHSTIDMVRNYVNLFGCDLENQFKKFSPIDRL